MGSVHASQWGLALYIALVSINQFPIIVPHKHTKATDSCLMYMRAVWYAMCIVPQCDNAVYDLVDDDTLEWFYAIHFIGMKRNF